MADFSRAIRKLEEARTCLNSMSHVQDAIAARTAYCAFINSCRTVTNALQKDGASIEGFTKWYEEKQDDMREDKLLRYFHEARINDFHKGEELLGYTTFLSSFGVSPPPVKGAQLIMGGEGPFWIVNQGSPDEQRIPARIQGDGTSRIYVKNPPREHKGKVISTDSPADLCNYAFRYVAELIHEARKLFQ